MDESVQGLIDETGKLAVNPENPEYSTNWCDIPMEMRMECIKRMDFKTRTRLGATSHTEKSLVEAKKYKYDVANLMYCSCNRQDLHIITQKPFAREYAEYQLYSINDHKKMLNCLVQVLKNCEIDRFNFHEFDKAKNLRDFRPEIEKCAPFRFKTFNSRSTDPENALFLLKNCEGVENVFLHSMKDHRYEFKDFLKLPVVINAKSVKLFFLHDPDDFHPLIKKWIINKSEVGKSLKFMYEPHVSSVRVEQSFYSEFANRVCYKNDAIIRIRTNDESKHILFQLERTYFAGEGYSCTIIPSNLPESEYEKAEEWVMDMVQQESIKEFNDETHYRLTDFYAQKRASFR